jgi:reactive intermediate/imine deaminase
MDKTQVNPWTWQDRFGFAQAWRVDGARSLVFVSGQTPLTQDGTLAEAGFEGQARQVFENLRTVLAQAGATLDSVVKLTVFVTDISQMAVYRRVKAEFMTGEPPASSAVEVSALAVPGMLIEVEAIAVL